MTDPEARNVHDFTARQDYWDHLCRFCGHREYTQIHLHEYVYAGFANFKDEHRCVCGRDETSGLHWGGHWAP